MDNNARWVVEADLGDEPKQDDIDVIVKRMGRDVGPKLHAYAAVSYTVANRAEAFAVMRALVAADEPEMIVRMWFVRDNAEPIGFSMTSNRPMKVAMLKPGQSADEVAGKLRSN